MPENNQVKKDGLSDKMRAALSSIRNASKATREAALVTAYAYAIKAADGTAKLADYVAGQCKQWSARARSSITELPF